MGPSGAERSPGPKRGPIQIDFGGAVVSEAGLAKHACDSTTGTGQGLQSAWWYTLGVPTLKPALVPGV